MIIRPMSDIHLEFDGLAPWFMPVIEGESEMVLILAGDITAKHNTWKDNPGRDTYTPWVKDVCARHKAVIYVPGNHESYSGVMDEVEHYWRNMANNVDNLHFLNKETVVIDGVRFIGCTLWTELPPHQVVSDMNDFDMISVPDEVMEKRAFTIPDWRIEHEACRYFLDTELAKDFDGETVVVTHHAPSFQSIGEKFAGKSSNVFYANNLEKLMWYMPIKLWIHGHVHNSMDYIVGDELQSTRVVCNPRGYFQYDVNRDFNPRLTIEV